MNEPPAPAPVSSFRLVGTLAAFGAIAGFALVFAYEATQPRIRRNKAEALKKAIYEVLHDPARYETLYLVGGQLTPEPQGRKEKLERVYLGYDADGKRVGFAVAAAEPGFQDVVGLIFGYDPEQKTLLGMRVLESKETPGLGDKIVKDAAFYGQFEGAATPILGVRAGRKKAGNEIDMITGATISSRAVIRIINHALERWAPLLDAYAGGEAGR